MDAPTDTSSPWYRRAGILLGSAAAIAGVATVMAGSGEPVAAPAAEANTPQSVSFSLIATDYWAPEPAPAPPPAAAPPPAPAPEAAPAPAPRRAAPRPAPVEEAPEVYVPPPPPPKQLMVRWDPGGPATVVSIANNGDSAVNCTRNSVPTAGIAASVNFVVPDEHFTVFGTAEARVREGVVGPPTGSTFHVTVTCDNGLSASMDGVF